MSWREALMSLQVLAELGVGRAARLAILQAKAQEDAAFDAGVSALTGVDPRGTG